MACAPRSPRARGFVCPKCDRPLSVDKTIRAASGVVVRYRVCETPRCRRHTVVTEERKRKLVALAK